MAKVTNVNINTINPATSSSEIGYGIYSLMTLLLANGWTFVSRGSGSGVRNDVSPLTQLEWNAAPNTWQIVRRGSVYFTMRRVSAISLDVRFAVTAPQPTGTGTSPDPQATATNEVAFTSIGITLTSRAHVITFDSDDNAAGIRSFYLLFTDGTPNMRGTVVFEAMADGTYASANPHPYVVAASSLGTPLRNDGGSWAFWHSPTSVWSTGNNLGVPALTTAGNYIFGANTGGVGVDPWTSKDPNFPAIFGRPAGPAAPGLIGMSKHLKLAGVNRGYLNTVDTATDAYAYFNCCLIPYANNTAPI